MAAKSKIVFNAEPQDVFEVLTDYESYPEFIPEIGSAKIIEEGAGYVVADFTLHAGKTINYVLRFEPRPFDKITWTYVRGDMRDNHGSWTLKPVRGGTEGLYVVTMDLGRLVPKFLLTALAGVGLPSILKHFKERVESGEAKRVVDYAEETANFERRLIRRYLRRAQGDIARAAKQMSITEAELKKRMKALGL